MRPMYKLNRLQITEKKKIHESKSLVDKLDSF